MFVGQYTGKGCDYLTCKDGNLKLSDKTILY